MAVTLTMLLALSFVEQKAVRSITDDALWQTQDIIEAIRGRQFDAAMQKSHALDRAWDERAKKLETLVNHSSTDEVRYALSRLIAALEEQDAATAMVYACELEGSVEHVAERQAMTLENIL